MLLKWGNSTSPSEFVGRLAIIMAGFFLCALSTVITIQAGLGVGAWDVFHLGLSNFLPLTVGQSSQVTGLLILILALFLGVKPGLGTVLNMFFIGQWVDVIRVLNFVPTAEPIGGVIAQAVWVIASIFILGLGCGLYIKAGLGAGPRDSFMLALVRKTGWRVATCRGVLEISACGVGWLMGGPVGVATIVIALGIGPAVELGFKICQIDAKNHH